MEIKRLIGILIVLLALAGCKQGQLPFLTQTYPHQDYGNQLKKQGLQKTRLGKQWLEQAQEALEKPVSIDIPFSLNGVFYSGNVEALTWKFNLKRGTSLEVFINWQSPDSAKLFVDIFFFDEGQWTHLKASEENKVQLGFESKETGEYLLRVQPELLGEGRFSLKIQQAQTYSVFPVQGKDSRAIWSVFGDDRDGGKRRHEGIDIFADRGTPVVAPVSGRVSSIRNGGLGGKSVWMRDGNRGHSLYFAHLDSQAVSSGRSVQPGDTLGFVGNTGNARTTRPHLHFGIYASFRGAIDPYPFVDNRLTKAQDLNEFPDTKYLVLEGSKANFRYGPDTDFEIIEALKEGELVWVKGQTEEWVQVETPFGQNGFIHSSLLKSVPSTIEEPGEDQWAFWDPFAYPADSFQVGQEQLSVLGFYDQYKLVQDGGKNTFWINSN